MDNRFFHVRFDGDRYLTSGISSCFLGHCVERPDAPHDGIFSQWKWDGEQLTIGNDRYGILPLYYFAIQNEICVSPSLPTLIERGAPGDLDNEALAVFFRLGYFLGESTPFRAIRALPPRVQFTWNKDGVSCVAEYPRVGWSDLSRDKAIEAYAELFSASVRRRIPDDSNGVLLSGGRDSRHILLELCRQGRPPNLVGIADIATSTDRDVAQFVAESLSIPHRCVPQSRPSLAAMRRNMYETNFCADEHSWLLDLRDDLTDKTPCLWDGLAGDVLSAGLFLDEARLKLYRAGSLPKLASLLIDGEEKYLKSLLRPSYYKLVSNEIALESITAELGRHTEAPNPVGSFIFWNRTRREIALSPFGLFRRFKVYVPYLDHELFDFLASLPAEMLLDHKFHDDTIARTYPEWAHLPYSRKREQVFAAGLGRGSWLAMLTRRSAWLNPMYLLPRLLAAALHPDPDRSFIADLPLYLFEIQNLKKRRAVVTFEAAAPSRRADAFASAH